MQKCEPPNQMSGLVASPRHPPVHPSANVSFLGVVAVGFQVRSGPRPRNCFDRSADCLPALAARIYRASWKTLDVDKLFCWKLH